MNRKMLRDQIELVTLAGREDGAPRISGKSSEHIPSTRSYLVCAQRKPIGPACGSSGTNRCLPQAVANRSDSNSTRSFGALSKKQSNEPVQFRLLKRHLQRQLRNRFPFPSISSSFQLHHCYAISTSLHLNFYFFNSNHALPAPLSDFRFRRDFA